ncbi:hypothetical protein EBZ80_18280 [bacterium]|nr:hypothetical protein [Betaproteobacteria bacterium]NDE16875.1 hypothetical protein [bacterium]
MPAKEDLRLQYLIANKEPVTADMIEELLLRAFASSFCGEQEEAMASTTIAQLSGCLCSLRLAAAHDEDDDVKEAAVEAKILRGPAAEQFYCNEVIRLYKANGADQLYAEEAATWPDVLVMDAEYMEGTLRQFAKIEVGHDLLVGDYLRARYGANQTRRS